MGPKLVLAVIDGCKPSELDRAVATGQAPALAAVIERGTVVRESCAAFPSVTPVCATSIATGVLQDRHHIPSMNWFHREERRYVEYGSSLRAAVRLGVAQQLTDTVYNLNARHLNADVPTLYESLDDAGFRTAGTTYLVYRGRHDHEVARDTAYARVAGLAGFRRGVKGPRELFYADLFASRDTGVRSQLGMPGVRDRHSGGVAAWLAARDLFDFLLLSLPDNDTHSHKHGTDAQATSIAAADREIARVAEASGGLERFLDTHAVIMAADHSHADVERTAALTEIFQGFSAAGARGRDADDAEIALCPAQRSAMVYVLVPEGRATLLPKLVHEARSAEAVDVVAWRDEHGWSHAVSRRGELRFRRGGAVRDPRGGRWSVDGDLGALALRRDGDVVHSATYPDALRRLDAALSCPTSGDVLLSAAPGWEFLDWGGGHHVGGSSHGSLHHSDSLGALAFCGVQPPHGHTGAWSITDVAPMVRAHFGL
ncbi:MAG TPA: alkaline phosphatase family protein [Baekduia sp.]|nr:alkaline phosphatase family protein [Baekduia sp.]